jgi:hypothetical protein
MAVLPPVDSPLSTFFSPFCSRVPSVAEALAALDARVPVGWACWGVLVRVRIEVTTITAGVWPGMLMDGVTRMMDVCTSVTGGADDAVRTFVVAGCWGWLEAGCGAADDCAGGGALEAAGGGALEAAGGGVLAVVGEFTGDCWDGDGACEAGGAAEEGGLDGAGAAEEGAGAAEGTASLVSDGDAGGEEASGCAEAAAGLEGTAKEESNVLAVPLLDMLAAIARRKKSRSGRTKKTVGRRQRQVTTVASTGRKEAPQLVSAT